MYIRCVQWWFLCPIKEDYITTINLVFQEDLALIINNDISTYAVRVRIK